MYIYQYLFSSINQSACSLELEPPNFFSSKVVKTGIKKIKKGAEWLKNRNFSLSDLPQKKVCPLDIEYLIDIYDNLDANSKRFFQTTCKSLWIGFNLSETLLTMIEEFIFENYKLIGCTNIKKFFLSKRRGFLGFGDQHTIPAHQLLNSILPNLFPFSNAEYFIEGGETALRYWKAEGERLKYFRQKIGNRIQTWDLDPLETENPHELLEFSAEHIYKTQQLFKLYEDEEWTFQKFCTFLESQFDQTAIDIFWVKASSKLSLPSKHIKNLLNNGYQITSFHRTFVMRFLKMLTLEQILNSYQHSPLFDDFDKEIALRNSHLYDCL